jgi:cobalt/nickel transport system ATP-binding protein
MTPPTIDVRELGYHYADGTVALDGVSFSLDVGERVALLGPTGSGKSTLLQHLNGLLRPQTGAVKFGGTPVDDASVAAVRRAVGLVFQNPEDQLFLPTLIEDVAFAPLNEGREREEARRRALAVLEELGLAEAAHRPAHHLSGGEKRLAALATVLVSQPQVLVLDEPTGDLDARSRQRLVQLLRERPETLLVATHDLDVARALCTRAVVLRGGALAEDGLLADVLADAERLLRWGLAAPL